VLAVYAAGYARTQSAANRFASQVAERRVAAPDPLQRASPIVDLPTAAPEAPIAEAVPKAAISSDAKRDALFKPDLIASAESLPAKANVAESAAVTSPVEVPAPVMTSFASPEVAPVASPVAEPALTPAEHKVEPPPASAWKDGAYTGWGYSRHGNIEASVVIEGGRIASATISQCRTRYSCSVIDQLPPQVAQRQSPNVDYVSGATQSADAFYGAVVAALSKAK
jgi:uncharacterized protein with FMN-binding domain